MSPHPGVRWHSPTIERQPARGCHTLTFVLLLASAGLRQASGGLAIAGAFCLVGCLAMLMRTGMAEGSGEPIPDDSPPGVLPKIGRSIARSERERVPLNQRSWQVLLAVALVLLIAAGWAIAASVIGPFPAIVAVGIAAWITLILYVRASQKSLTLGRLAESRGISSWRPGGCRWSV